MKKLNNSILFILSIAATALHAPSAARAQTTPWQESPQGREVLIEREQQEEAQERLDRQHALRQQQEMLQEQQAQTALMRQQLRLEQQNGQ